MRRSYQITLTLVLGLSALRTPTAFSFVPAVLVVFAVYKKSKLVASLAQLGGLQERESNRTALKHGEHLSVVWGLGTMGLPA
jgi:hypothetical protein